MIGSTDNKFDLYTHTDSTTTTTLTSDDLIASNHGTLSGGGSGKLFRTDSLQVSPDGEPALTIDDEGVKTDFEKLENTGEGFFKGMNLTQIVKTFENNIQSLQKEIGQLRSQVCDVSAPRETDEVGVLKDKVKKFTLLEDK